MCHVPCAMCHVPCAITPALRLFQKNLITWTVFVQVVTVGLFEKGHNMFNGQMEMSFGRGAKTTSDRHHRHNRAEWWFRRMRQIVDLASDWQPAPPPRPVQIWLPVSENRRPTRAVSRRHSPRSTREHLVCE
jgi:hypothetical protein